MDERPISQSALHILLHLGWVIERKLDVMESPEFLILQNGDAVTIGSNGEFDKLGPQVRQHSLEIGMHPVLARPQIHRPDGQPFHHSFDFLQCKAIRARRIAVTESTRKIAFIGQPQSKRNTVWRTRYGWD